MVTFWVTPSDIRRNGKEKPSLVLCNLLSVFFNGIRRAVELCLGFDLKWQQLFFVSALVPRTRLSLQRPVVSDICSPHPTFSRFPREGGGEYHDQNYVGCSLFSPAVRYRILSLSLALLSVFCSYYLTNGLSCLYMRGLGSFLSRTIFRQCQTRQHFIGKF